MSKKIKQTTRLLSIAIIFVLLCSCTTKIYLVRHAEKLNNSANPPLSNIGQQRAIALRDSLIGKNIDSVFVSTYSRTQQTAQPLCNALHEEYIIYNADTSLQLAMRLKNVSGKNILVVGHSTSIPAMVNAIANRQVAIPDSIYNKMFIITIYRGFKTSISLNETTYGAPSP
jgi:broad specificity phosphatase PhoE